ncbi:GNAT family N-acetyltransferase [Nonomuraea sp. NPDC050536]|uniref:GNAT family N-acetyltransferase n=1 Tax=Nonomuraea sp. NPDC050536 TaxID=3364366 RepID=UPI0037C9C69C
MADYRTAVPTDEPGILAVWGESFPGALEAVRADWEAVPERNSRTFVAADSSGVLAVVLYVPRLLRSSSGTPVRVGGVGAVATRADARRRGHARRLLELALEAMAGDGCAWSLLFTGSQHVYASLGWRPFPLCERTAEPPPPVPPAGGVRPVPVAEWRTLAPIHAAFNAHRPLTAVRAPADWTRGVGRRLGPPARLFAYADRGYVALADRGERLELAELAVLDEEAAWALAGHAASLAGGRPVTIRCPRDPLTEPALRRAFGVLRPGGDEGMARPVHAGAAEIEALSRAPEATFWLADGF